MGIVNDPVTFFSPLIINRYSSRYSRKFAFSSCKVYNTPSIKGILLDTFLPEDAVLGNVSWGGLASCSNIYRLSDVRAKMTKLRKNSEWVYPQLKIAYRPGGVMVLLPLSGWDEGGFHPRCVFYFFFRGV